MRINSSATDLVSRYRDFEINNEVLKFEMRSNVVLFSMNVSRWKSVEDYKGIITKGNLSLTSVDALSVIVRGFFVFWIISFKLHSKLLFANFISFSNIPGTRPRIFNEMLFANVASNRSDSIETNKI